MSPGRVVLSVGAAALLISGAMVTHAFLTRYQIVERTGTPVVLRIDRMTGKIDVCLPKELSSPDRLVYHCDGRTDRP